MELNLLDGNNLERCDNRNPITVCATSARWLSQSACKAGFDVQAMDEFGDWDLQLVCENWVQFPDESAPRGSIDLSSSGPLLFGGGLETRLKEIRRFAESDNWRNATIQSIEFARDPFYWTNHVNQAGFETAAVSGHRPTTAQKNWVHKSYESTGGQGVRWAASTGTSRSGYWQEFIPGQAYSSLHVASDSDIQTLGLFLQLTGKCPSANLLYDTGILFADPIFNAAPFHFAGAIGPINLADFQGLRGPFERAIEIAQVITQATKIRGVFGIDWIQSSRGELIPIEINPRFTASAELLERASCVNMVDLHLQTITKKKPELPEFVGMAGKAYLFNQESRWTVSQTMHEKLVDLGQAGLVADIPFPGTVIQPGVPIATLLVDNSDTDSQLLIQTLVQRAHQIRQSIADDSKHE